MELLSTGVLKLWTVARNCSTIEYVHIRKIRRWQSYEQKIIADNYPDGFQQSKPIVEVPIEWYKNQIKVNANLPMDFKPTGSPIDESMYPSTKAKELSKKDLKDLDRFIFVVRENVELNKSTQKIQLLIQFQWQLNMIKHE